MRALILLFCIVLSTYSVAGSQQSTEIKHQPEDIVAFAKSVEKYAAKQGARAFIISRLGQERSSLPKGVNFTHSALAIYSDITLDNGEVAKGYAIYNLYQNEGNKNRSSIVVDYPVDFFWGAAELTAGIVIPSPKLQQRLIESVIKGDHLSLHNPKYSLISNPNNNKYQNCNEHLLNLVNAAIYQTTDMAQLKANTRAHFSPQRIRINGVKLALGGLFVDGIRTSDHKGKIYTTTFTSIGKYLKENDLAKDIWVLTHGKEIKTI